MSKTVSEGMQTLSKHTLWFTDGNRSPTECILVGHRNSGLFIIIIIVIIMLAHVGIEPTTFALLARDVCNGAAVKKFCSVKPVLGDWRSSCRWCRKH